MNFKTKNSMNTVGLLTPTMTDKHTSVSNLFADTNIGILGQIKDHKHNKNKDKNLVNQKYGGLLDVETK